MLKDGKQGAPTRTRIYSRRITSSDCIFARTRRLQLPFGPWDCRGTKTCSSG